MTLQQINYFLILAKELHFWKTAEKIFISQSSLSRQIQSLEEELGVVLFERDKRNVKLTTAGKFLQEQWTVKLKEFDQIHRQAKKIEEGEFGIVSITYPGSISYKFLPNFLEVLNSNLPDLKLELTEPTDENHEKLLLDYRTDIAFSRDQLKNPSIESLKLYSEPICLAVPKDHWFVQQKSRDISELKNEKFLISGLHHTTFFGSLLRELFIKYGFEPNTTIESDFGGMIVNLVAKKIGISILPYSYKFSKAKDVKFIELDEKIDLYINWRKDELNKTIHKVVKFAELINK